MTPLDQLENRSITILREAYAAYARVAMLWSIGKEYGAHAFAFEGGSQ